MRALRLLEWKTEPALVEIQRPTAGPGEVVIRVGGAGACRSDLTVMRDYDSDRRPWRLPFTLGHETAGWVAEIGEGVRSFEVDQPVVVYAPWGCGRCPSCSLGLETYCQHKDRTAAPGGGAGLGRDGGMAEFMRVPDAERHLVALPAGLEPRRAAPLADAGLTAYHAVARSWDKLRPGSVAVVIGVGGLGHLAIQILKATTATTVVAVDLEATAVELATRVGADHALPGGPRVAELVRDLAGPRGAEVVLDFVGSQDSLDLARSLVGPLSDLTIVGLARGTVPVGFPTIDYEVSVQTSYWGSSRELVEVVDLAARGLIDVETCEYSLEDAAQAYVDLAQGRVRGRAVVIPGTRS
ncbi:NAD(P)-dependent alcohol dehydrogenase [Nocardioides panacihumi]|uniref:alcohol dehydrogenase n=1 Tax=Nocardioides panacihumi TaxID=400774 RepID=A0ABN2RJP7_9ACTN